MFWVRSFLHFLWLLCQCFLWYLLHLRFSLLSLVFCWWCLHLWLLIYLLGFLFPELSPFVIFFIVSFSIFRSWMVLFSSFTCLVLISCNYLRDFCVSSLRSSTCLPVFSCVSLRELFMSIMIMRSNFRSISFFSNVLGYSRLALVAKLVSDDAD